MASRRVPWSGKTGACLLAAVFLGNSAWVRAQGPVPTIAGFVNAATGRSSSSVPAAARGSLITIFGSNLATGTMSASGFPLPIQSGGTQVLFGGVPAPLLYVSPAQINAQVPFEIPDVSSVNVVVQTGNGASAALQVILLAQDPGIFLALKAGAPVSASNPVMPADSITIYATGLGSVLPSIPSGQPGPSSPPAVAAITPIVEIGGQPATIDFAGMAPSQAIYQINATAPLDLAAPTSIVTLEPGVIPAVVGPPGPAGPPGDAGPPGLAGAAGFDGATGAQGPAGAQGASGASGSNGGPGANGATGPAGAPGPPGLTGAAGPQGDTGAAGAPGISWQGIWSAGNAYIANNAVAYNGSIYFSTQASTNQEPDTSPAFWTLLAGVGATGATGATGASGPTGPTGAPGAPGSTGAPGPQGDTGATGAAGISWQGIWSAGIAYVANNAVAYNGSIYFSVQNGIDQEPDTSPAFWTLLAGVGAPGATGATGASGPAGPPGATGAPGLTGAPGPQGVIGATGAAGISWQGIWSPGITYVANNAVAYNGSIYFSVQDGIEQEPDTSPAFWTLLAGVGAPGATGATGPSGPSGPPGATGAPGSTGAQGPQG